MHNNSKLVRILEMATLFVGFPTMYAFVLPSLRLFAVLFIAAILAVIILRLDPSYETKAIWRTAKIPWRDMMIRFGIFAFITGLGVYFFLPDSFLIILKTRPGLMALIFVFYPIWSAFPQELLFRSLFYHRYINLFPNQQIAIFTNAVLFAYAHIIFENWLAVVATFFLSLLVSRTYFRSGSVLATTIEHSLYGNFVFLIGLGEFFYKVPV